MVNIKKKNMNEALFFLIFLTQHRNERYVHTNIIHQLENVGLCTNYWRQMLKVCKSTPCKREQEKTGLLFTGKVG